MIIECYNPYDMVGHNLLGYECDGHSHLSAPEVESSPVIQTK